MAVTEFDLLHGNVHRTPLHSIIYAVSRVPVMRKTRLGLGQGLGQGQVRVWFYDCVSLAYVFS